MPGAMVPGEPVTPPTRVGFYVHHHGRGHLSRTLAVLDHLEVPATVLTTMDIDPGSLPEGVELVALPPDCDGVTPLPDPTAGGALHWAPLAPSLLKPRAAAMAAWLTRPDVATLVCDVSVEAALLARLCGVAPIVVRELGDRSDAVHRLGVDVAVGLLAPFPVELEHPDTPASLRDASFYSGFLRRPDGSAGVPAPDRRELGLEEGPLLVIAVGAGGHSFDLRSLPEVAAALEGWQVVLIGAGPTGPSTSAPTGRAQSLGWVEDVRPYLDAADVVASAAGTSLVAEVAAAGVPFVCVPETRPFDEQRARASRLAELGAACVRSTWPQPEEWPDVVAEALAIGGGRLAAMAASATPAGTARWIEATAAAAVDARGCT